MKKGIAAAVLAVGILMLFLTASAEENYCWYLEANGEHDFEQTDAGYATCEEPGYFVLECRQCGYYKKQTTGKAAGHDWVETHREEPGDGWIGIVIEACNNCSETRSQKLYAKGTLYRGVKDSAGVKDLQRKLIECGYLNDSADGVFGKNTEAAVKKFQKAAKMNADGIAYPKTLKALDREWQQKKNTPIPTAAPTPIPTPIPAQESVEKHYAPFCYSWEDENGMMVTEQCERHALLWEATLTLLADKSADSALHSYYEWQAEIISLYNEWAEQVDEATRAKIETSKAHCVLLMETQLKTMWSSYDANGTDIDPDDVYYGAELWMRNHAMWLCQMMSTLGGAQ